MWLPNKAIDAVDAVARIHYIDKAMCAAWNKQRRGHELRLLTGWTWQAKANGKYQMGLKTYTMAVRDAYYALVVSQAPPGLRAKK